MSLLDSSVIHPPVTIKDGSEEYLQIGDDQELAFYPQSLIDQITETIEKTITEKITENNTTYVNTIVNSSAGEVKYSVIKETSLAAYTFETIWEVIALFERMGEFKTTVLVHDLSTDNVYQLQS